MSDRERAKSYARQTLQANADGADNDLIVLAREFLRIEGEASWLRGSRPGNGWGGPFGAGPSDMPRGGW